MSNRNFDSRVIIQRLKDKNQAQNLYGSQSRGQTMITNPQNSDPSPQTINNFKTGVETTYWKGLLGGAYTVDTGAVANFFGAPLIPPSAPTNLVGTPTAGQVSVAFTPGAAGSSPITNYFYSIDGGVTFIACSPAVTASPVVITGLTTGSTYSIALKARTDVGLSDPSQVISVLVAVPPSAPVFAYRGSTPGDRQVTVIFTQGSDGGSPVTNYQYSTNGGIDYTPFSPAVTTSPAVIAYLSDSPSTRLSNNAAYTVVLKAVNAAGTSDPSNSGVVHTYSSAPAPTGLSSTPGNTTVQISFSQSSVPYMAPITNYDYSTDGGATFSALSPATTVSPVTIAGLTNNTTYQVQLRAVNAAGASAASSSVSAPTFYAPSPPTLTSSTPGNGQVTIAFTAGADGGSAITNYEYSTNDGATFTAFSPADTVSPNTIMGLANATTYLVRLRAVNAAGAGAASTAISAQTAYPPQAPTALSAAPGDGQAIITFTVGSNGGSAITNYKYSTDNGATFIAFSPADIASPVTITGLTNGTTYQIQLIAVNVVGDSGASSSVSVTPAPAVPGAPTITSLVGGNQAIYILYTAGPVGGTPITNYGYSIDNGVTFAACSPPQIGNPLILSDPSLVNGTSYSVIIQAINAGGPGASSNMISVTPQPNTRLATGLIIELDAGNASSYPGSGSAWTNLQSGGSYSGTLENGPTYSSNFGGMLTFNGTNQVATIADNAAIRATTSQYITAQVWARVDSSFTGGDGIIGKQYWSPSYDGFSLSLNTNNSSYLKMNGASVDGTYGSPAGVFTTGTWTLFTAVVCFGGRSTNPSYVYINPFRVATGNNAESSIPNNTAPLQFPRGINNGIYNYCPADIGQIFYYTDNLTQEDIIRNYDATKARYAPI